MKIKSLQSKYIQKSRIFLYPLLGIKRGVSVTPIQTYMAWENIFSFDDNRLMCVYHTREDLEFKNFYKQVLLKNKYFEDFFNLEDGTGVFVFDFSPENETFQKIVNGKYSKLDEKSQGKISNFFKHHYTHHMYVLSYLSPFNFISEYATLLNIDSNILYKVGELCSPPDLINETLCVKKKNTNFESIKDSLTNK